jgi:hypothetical protein
MKIIFMFTILLSKVGSELENVSRKINAKEDIVIDCVRERDEFKRAYGEINLSLHNFDGYFTNLFFANHPSVKFSVEVWNEGRRLFQGRVQQPATCSLKDKWMKIHVYDINKEFWERAKSIRIGKITTTQDTLPGGARLILVPQYAETLSQPGKYATMDNALKDLITTPGMFSDMFMKQLDLGEILSSIVVVESRKYYQNNVWNSANEFSFSKISPESTLEDFLLDAAQFLNAEFFVNPATGLLTARKRKTVLNDTQHQLDNSLLKENAIISESTDLKTYDYVHLQMNLPDPTQLSVWTGEVSGTVTLQADSIKHTRTVISGNTIESLFITLKKNQNIYLPDDREFKITISGSSTAELNGEWTVRYYPIDNVISMNGDSSHDYSLIPVSNFLLDNGTSIQYVQDNITGGFTESFFGYVQVYIIQIPGTNRNVRSNGSAATQSVINIGGKKLFSFVTALPGPVGTIRRIIMRRRSDADYRVVKVIEGNETAQFIDNVHDSVLKQEVINGNQIVYEPIKFNGGIPANANLTQFNFNGEENLPIYSDKFTGNALDIWIQYDEQAGIWKYDIQSSEDAIAPPGKIFEFKTHLKDAEGKVLKVSDLVQLFNNNFDIDLWKPFFLTHRKVTTEVKGTNYAVGDSMISDKNLFPNDFTNDRRMVIKNSKIHLNKKYTEIEAFTI